MTENSDQPAPPALVRTEPVQQRSTLRVAALLDAAAELIDEAGIDALTTSEVATRSGSSVGVVYRYFPNIQSLLRALAARNLERFAETIESSLTSEALDWTHILDVAIDTFIAFTRSEPGFRSLRFGDIVDDRFLEPEFSNNGVLARSFVGLLADKYDVQPDDSLLFDLEVVVEIADALLQRAFLLDRAGDERFIARARELCTEYLTTHLTTPGAE